MVCAPVAMAAGRMRHCCSKTVVEEGMAALKAGDVAPDFELSACTGKQKHKFKLSDLRGKKNVVVAFYPLDWSPT